MIFNDPDLRLNIQNTQSGPPLSFKAYLEDSDISYETKDQQLPFVPLSFTNDSMALRVSEKAKFTFNVFSETRSECIQNYRNLNLLLQSIKPSYSYVFDQVAPYISNVTGFFNLNFKGMPDGRDNINLHLTSFSYAINKDLGYVHVPLSEIDGKEGSFYDSAGMKLIPVGYKISIEGKILLEFNKTANVYGNPSADPDISGEITKEQQQKQAQTEADTRTVQQKNIDDTKKMVLLYYRKLKNDGYIIDDKLDMAKVRSNKFANSDLDLLTLFSKKLEELEKNNVK